MFPTHILSHNHLHHMCIREAIGTRKSLEFTVLQQDSKIHRFYSLNLRQSVSITELCRIQVLIDTPHILCLTTTSLTRVSVSDLWSNTYPKIAQTYEMGVLVCLLPALLKTLIFILLHHALCLGWVLSLRHVRSCGCLKVIFGTRPHGHRPLLYSFVTFTPRSLTSTTVTRSVHRLRHRSTQELVLD
jgi:hypothetical protein